MSTANPITEAEVRAFVEDWYLVKLDTHAPVADIAAMVQPNVEFVLPETSFVGREAFCQWYERIVNTFFDEVHTITELTIVPAGTKAEVKVVVNWQARTWQGPAAKSNWLGFDAYQTWEMKRSPETGQVAIQRYVVDRFEPMAGSTSL